MSTRSVVTTFILFIIGIMLGRCSAPAPYLVDGGIDVKAMSNDARQCLYSNLPSIHTDRAFDFVAADCQINSGYSH
ncbi:hypothetical protein [Zymobacter palmae]|nr:hypothetical protein [Zymobacter palmae]